MPGLTKRKFEKELINFNKSLKRPLNLIYEILPCDYDKYILLKYFKELYPFEWKTIIERYKLYTAKDDFLEEKGKKRRYKHLPPDQYFFNMPKVKHILSKGQKRKHKTNCDDKEQNNKYQLFKKKREIAIKKRQKKIKENKKLLQTIEPLFIDIFINFYHRKGNSIEEKIEIIKELQKYDSKKVIEFFYKINDAEKNNQIRRLTFKHLQNLGYYVKLRKNFKGKKKDYMLEKTKFEVKPEDLFKRLENKTTPQYKKQYDFFISHSYKDYDKVIEIKNKLNEKGYVIYCDWMSDNEFLKRKNVSDFTWYVLQKRIEQSKRVLFILTENSKNKSDWIKKELEYAKSINKEILCIKFIDEICEFKEIFLQEL
jgi:hypothetical protein